MVNMDIVWGALAGAGIGGVAGAIGGSKWAVVGGVAAGAVVGGLIGYGISGLWWDLSQLGKSLSGLSKGFQSLGAAVSGAIKTTGEVAGESVKIVETQSKANPMVLATAIAAPPVGSLMWAVPSWVWGTIPQAVGEWAAGVQKNFIKSLTTLW